MSCRSANSLRLFSGMIGASSCTIVLRRDQRGRRGIERLHVAVLADHRRRADGQVQVGRALPSPSRGTTDRSRELSTHDPDTSVTSTMCAALTM